MCDEDLKLDLFYYIVISLQLNRLEEEELVIWSVWRCMGERRVYGGVGHRRRCLNTGRAMGQYPVFIIQEELIPGEQRKTLPPARSMQFGATSQLASQAARQLALVIRLMLSENELASQPDRHSMLQINVIEKPGSQPASQPASQPPGYLASRANTYPSALDWYTVRSQRTSYCTTAGPLIYCDLNLVNGFRCNEISMHKKPYSGRMTPHTASRQAIPETTPVAAK
ncbi:hypothetical protein F4604DRAFT_1974330 [Suillus subluteus]|nr:hypothetical protein F4604DRAFT_1974330 [Suillus subluteus]